MLRLRYTPLSMTNGRNTESKLAIRHSGLITRHFERSEAESRNLPGSASLYS